MQYLDSKKKLFLSSSFNGLTQKLWVYFSSRLQQDRVMIGVDPTKINEWSPDIIICPYLKQYIPKKIWEAYPCFVVHPGPPGDGGPSSLNWAILEGKNSWGTSIIQAAEGWDTGPLWATKNFNMPQASAAHIYRNHVSDSIMSILPQALDRYFSGESSLPQPAIVYRPQITLENLAFDWEEKTETILRKINAGDSQPGTVGIIEGQPFQLYGASKGEVPGQPGKILEKRMGQVCIGTGDGSIWIRRLAQDRGVKIRAADLLAQ